MLSKFPLYLSNLLKAYDLIKHIESILKCYPDFQFLSVT